MKIAIDSGPLTSGHSVRGIGTYTRELLRAVDFKGVDVFKADLSKYDVVHFTSFNPFFVSLPFAKPHGTKFVVTIYDLIPLIYPDHYRAGIRGRIKFAINKFLINRNVDEIITISETSKKDICRFLGVKPEKVHVIYLAPKTVFGRGGNLKNSGKYNLPKKFVLYVGDINFNKNIPVLIKACRIAKIPLVIAGKQALDIEDLGIDLRTLKGPMDYVRYLFGKPHPELAHYADLMSVFKNSKDIVRLGFVPDSELVGLFKKASVYCQPSLYEGFGLPVLEAFAAGVPVVASKTQALVEIGEGGCLFEDPKNPKDFALKINRVMQDKTLRSQLIETGKAIVKNFSWEKVAGETMQVYAKK